MNALEKQLADLNVLCSEYSGNSTEGSHIRRLGPGIPPKKTKIHPQIPQSYSIQSACEPSYSARLETGSRNGGNAYSNVHLQKIKNSEKRLNSGDVRLYSNFLPPGGTNHIYTNVSNRSVQPNVYPQQVAHSNGKHRENEPAQSIYNELKPNNMNYGMYVPSSISSVNRQELATYGGSQTSSTYESLYEPINPRPASQMSSHSSASLYAPYISGRITSVSEQSLKNSVDYDRMSNITMNTVSEDDFFCGLCYNCGEKIIGETTGCTAMERVYHIKCFCCYQCKLNLQGRPFYTLNNKPYCEQDYLNTLEKCSICTMPILDRILRATGKPYHPHCFTCVVCQKSLDGIPFTVDAMNRIHCIEDFHNCYAPRCSICKQPIKPEADQDETVRVVALDRSFHVRCYACEDCRTALSSEAEGRGCYPLDDHIYCKSCNAKRIQDLTRSIV